MKVKTVKLTTVLLEVEGMDRNKIGLIKNGDQEKLRW